MKISVIGGDARQEYLTELLRTDGYEVDSYCGGGEAELYLFPLPTGDHPVLKELPSGSMALVAGDCGEYPDLKLLDYYDESVRLENAALTAEGALLLAMQNSPKALYGSRVFVCGFGRIGKRLCALLRAFQADICVCARSQEARTLAKLEGFRAVASTDSAEEFDFVFNTVPAPVFFKTPAALCIELASAPGGFVDGEAIISGSGLPGRTAPFAAAEILHRSILRLFKKEALS